MEPIKYYLKILTANELGYRNGKLATGQMFYVSKKATTFFPPLRSDVLNDTVSLEIVVDYQPHPIHVRYVYHNDKYNQDKGTRDEYRIYLNREIAPDDFFFRPNDIILLTRSATLQYKMERYRPNDLRYCALHEIISEYGTRGNHALLHKFP